MTVRRPFAWIALLACVACGDGAPFVPDASGNAGDADVDAPYGMPITVTTTQLQPEVVVYREAGQSTWVTATMTSPTSFTLWVNGPYFVTVVCLPRSNEVWVEQHARTLDDPREFTIWCDSPGDGPYRLTGDTVQPAWVWTNSAGHFTEPGDGFEARVPAGTYDVIAMTGQTSLRAERMALRRGVVVAGDVAIANAIDVVAEGVALAPLTVTAPNAMPAEVVRVRGLIGTLNRSSAPLFGSTALDNALFVPNSVLISTDVQTLTVSALSNGFARRVERRFRDGDSTEFTLPDPIGPVTFTRTGGEAVATWSTLPAHELIRSEITSASEELPFINHTVVISHAYETAIGSTLAATDTDIPGYRPEWRFDLEKPYTHSLSVAQRAGNDLLISSQSIQANEPPLPP